MTNINDFNDFLKFLECDTSATGGLSVSGMGSVVSAQPSSLPGTTIGPNWSDNGGTVGSGDVSLPYNPGGLDHKIYQKVPMSKNHGSRTGKKSRNKKIDLKNLRNSLKQDYTKNSTGKIMSFEDFEKSDINNVKR